MTPEKTWPESGRMASLDGLRALSILLVFLSHAGLGWVVPGGLGVTVFFFISGYLITTLMLREWQETGGLALRLFWLRRALRLGPPLGLALGLALVLVATGLTTPRGDPLATGGIDPVSLLAQVFFVFNYVWMAGLADPIPGTNVLWSLAVEEHFYLLWPLIFPLLAARRLGAGWVVAALLAFPLWRAVRFYLLGTGEEAIYYLSDTRLDSLLYGCALALCQYRGLMPAIRRPGLWLAVGLAGILVTLALRGPEMRAVLRFSLQGLALMPLFHLAVMRPDFWAMRPLNWSWVSWIGVWSYSFYLVHYLILMALAHVWPDSYQTPLWALAGGALALLWAAAVYRFAEAPMSRLRRRLH